MTGPGLDWFCEIHTNTENMGKISDFLKLHLFLFPFKCSASIVRSNITRTNFKYPTQLIVFSYKCKLLVSVVFGSSEG